MVNKRLKFYSSIACMLLIGAAISGCNANKQPAAEAPAAPTPPIATAAEQAAPAVAEAVAAPEVKQAVAEPTTKWEYRESEDKMTGKTTKFASITSDNELNLGFPYNDSSNSGYITVRKHPQHGIDVMVSVHKGQTMCQSYEDCTVTVRFDDDKPMQWAAVGPADNSSETVFLRNESRFIERAKKAKRILIGIPFYQNGTQVLEFTTPVSLTWGGGPKKSA